MSGTPMTIHLYGEDNEIKQTYTQPFVPWKMLKAAVKIAGKLDPEHMKEEDVDELAGLVVAVFKGKFSVEELTDGAEVSEMITVIRQIVGKANGLIENPTPPE
jgi:hypothetical protein